MTSDHETNNGVQAANMTDVGGDAPEPGPVDNNTITLNLTNCCLGCFSFLAIVHLVFACVILGYLPPMKDDVNEHSIRSWAICMIVCITINILLNLHTKLKAHYQRLVLERFSYQMIKVVVYVSNHILGWVILIWGFSQIYPALPDDGNISLTSGQEVSVALIEYLLMYTLVMYVIFYIFLLCIGCCLGCLLCTGNLQVGGQDAQHPASREAIAGHSIVKTFSEFLGIDQPSCQICADDYKANDPVRKLDCGHYFHQACVDTWFKQAETCPVCRQPVNKATDLRKDPIGEAV